MNFLEKMIATSINQMGITARAQSMSTPAVALKTMPETRTVLIDKHETKQLIQNQLE